MSPLSITWYGHATFVVGTPGGRRIVFDPWLTGNPKAPAGVVLPFINRLTLRDLKGLKDDRGVQQIVREMARKTYLLRTQKK